MLLIYALNICIKDKHFDKKDAIYNILRINNDNPFELDLEEKFKLLRNCSLRLLGEPLSKHDISIIRELDLDINDRNLICVIKNLLVSTLGYYYSLDSGDFQKNFGNELLKNFRNEYKSDCSLIFPDMLLDLGFNNQKSDKLDNLLFWLMYYDYGNYLSDERDSNFDFDNFVFDNFDDFDINNDGADNKNPNFGQLLNFPSFDGNDTNANNIDYLCAESLISDYYSSVARHKEGDFDESKFGSLCNEKDLDFFFKCFFIKNCTLLLSGKPISQVSKKIFDHFNIDLNNFNLLDSLKIEFEMSLSLYYSVIERKFQPL